MYVKIKWKTFRNLSENKTNTELRDSCLRQWLSVGCKGVHFSWMDTSNYEDLLSPSCALKSVAACVCKKLFSISASPHSNRTFIFVLQINKDGSFLIKDIQHSDEGNYSCSIENVYGSDEIVYSVRVLGMSFWLLQILLLCVYHTDISSYTLQLLV